MKNHILAVTQEAESMLLARRRERFVPGGEMLCLANRHLMKYEEALSAGSS